MTKFKRINNQTYVVIDDKELTMDQYKEYLKRTKEIKALKKELADTDYMVIKLAEAKVIGTEEEYFNLLSKYRYSLIHREKVRAKINELEK